MIPSDVSGVKRTDSLFLIMMPSHVGGLKWTDSLFTPKFFLPCDFSTMQVSMNLIKSHFSIFWGDETLH